MKPRKNRCARLTLGATGSRAPLAVAGGRPVLPKTGTGGQAASGTRFYRRSDRHTCRIATLALIASIAATFAGCSELIEPPPSPIRSNAVSAEALHGDWPVFRGDALAAGVATSMLPERLEVLWKLDFEDGAFESTAAIVDGTVYVGCLDGYLYAIDLESGEQKWRYRTELGFRAPAAVRDGAVFIGDEDGRFFSIDAASGERRWSYETMAEIDAGANFYQDTVIIGSQDATLYCFRADDGELVWKHSIEDMIRCSPTIVGDRTFVAGCDSRLHIIDLTKGRETAWVDLLSPTMCTPAVRGDRLFVGTEDAIFYCIDWKKAEIVWAYAPRRFAFRSSAAVTEEAIYLGGRDKMMRSLHPETGEEIWSFPTRGRIDSSPVVVGERLFFGAADGRLYALDRHTGEVRWEYEAGGGFIASPAVSEGRLVIGNDDGTLFCFGMRE